MDASPAAARPREITAAAAYAMLVGSPFLFATGVVIVRGVHETIPPVGLSFWRWFIAGLLILPFVAPRLVRDCHAVAHHWRYYTEMGFYMVGGSAIGAIALSFTTATNQSLVNASQPAMTAVFAWMLLHTRLGRWQAAGIATAAGGIMVMVSRADLGVVRSLAFNVGDLLMIVTVALYALYGVRLAKLPKDMSFATNLCAMLLCGSAVLLPFYVAESIVVKPVPTDASALGILAYLGTVGSLIPVFWWSRAVPVVGPNQAAVFVNLMPVFAVTLAYMFLDERLFIYHLAGAALIFAGISLVIRAESRTRRERRAEG